MSFVSTIDLLAAVKTALLTIAHPTRAGESLFERVEFHENKNLREALSDLVILKQRVAILVPSGDSYENLREGRTIRSKRATSFDILIADRAWTKGGHEAVFGGARNVGVLAMKEIVVNFFAESPQVGEPVLPYVVLTPTEGAEITIADDQVKDSPGRECYVLNYATPAGERVLTPTRPWSAS